MASAFNVDDADHELIAAAQRGERSAMDALVKRHGRWVWNTVFATVGKAAPVDDIVQQIWANAWKQIGTLVDPKCWRGWLYRLAKNAAIDLGQKAARDRRIRIMPISGEMAPSSHGDPARIVSSAEEHRKVLEAINGLPPIYREPFMLRHLEDWSYAKIGEALDLPVDTVETRLVRARRLLRAALAETEKEV